jgi:multiple sugar transport system permease protein
MSDVKTKILRLINKPKGLTLVLLGPSLSLFFLILIFPFLVEMYLSFTKWQPILGNWWEAEFIGPSNYIDLITKDYRFLNSLLRTALLVASVVGVEFALGLLLATIFTKHIKGKRLFFSLLLIPMMVMPIIVANTFRMLFQPSGPINFLLGLMMGRTVTIDWLVSPRLAFVALVITDIWHWTPFMFLVLLSGLVSLPQNPIDAAKVLGGSEWQIFKDIKLPLMKNIINIALVIRAMEAKNLFDEIFIMTGGGPGTATETISIYTYVHGAVNFRVGYTSAAAMIILILIVIVIGLAVRPILKELR